MTAIDYIMNGFSTVEEADHFLGLRHEGAAQILSDLAEDDGLTISESEFRDAIVQLIGSIAL